MLELFMACRFMTLKHFLPLTVGVTVGVAAVLVTGALLRNYERSMEALLLGLTPHIQIEKTMSLADADVQIAAIQQLEGVDIAQPSLRVAGTLTLTRQHQESAPSKPVAITTHLIGLPVHNLAFYLGRYQATGSQSDALAVQHILRTLQAHLSRRLQDAIRQEANQYYMEAWYLGDITALVDELIQAPGAWNPQHLVYLQKMVPWVDDVIGVKTALGLQQVVQQASSLARLGRWEPLTVLLNETVADRVPPLPVSPGEELSGVFVPTPGTGLPFKPGPLPLAIAVSGIVAERPGAGGTGTLIMALEHLQERFFQGASVVNTIDIRLQRPWEAPAMVAKLQALLDASSQIRHWLDVEPDRQALLRVLRVVLFAVSSLITVAAAFGVCAALYMLVLEKQAHIALLKALGATSGRIGVIFLALSVVIGLTGSLAGMVLGRVAAGWVGHSQHELARHLLYLQEAPLPLHGDDIVVVTLSTLTLCLLAALYPSLRAAKVDPIVGLQYK